MACDGGFELAGGACACAAGRVWSAALAACAAAPSAAANGSWFEAEVVPPLKDPPLQSRNAGEAVVLQGTLTLMSLWLALTLALRFAPLRGKWLRARFIVSQCDLLFHSHHWVDPQKVLAKRRTELGGAFTIAVWISFIGFALGTLYEQVAVESPVSKSVRDTTFADIQQWTVSLDAHAVPLGGGTSCGQLVGASVSGLSADAADASSTWGCEDTDAGALVSFACERCTLTRTAARISLSFAGEGVQADGVEWEVCSPAPLGHRIACTRGAEHSDRPLAGDEPTEISTRLVPEVIYASGELAEQLYQLRLSEVAPAVGGAAGAFSVDLIVELESDWLILRTKDSSTDGFVTFLSKLGGLWTLCLTVFMLVLTQSEVHIHKLRYDDKLLIGLERQRRTVQKWEYVVGKLMHSNFVAKRARLEQQVRRRRESLMGEAAGLVRARADRQRLRGAGALDVLRSIGTGIMNWTSPRTPRTPGTPGTPESAGFERVRFTLARRERQGYVLRRALEFERARARASASPTSSYGGDDATPTMGEPLSPPDMGGKAVAQALSDRTNLQSVEEAADAAMHALREPLAQRSQASRGMGAAHPPLRHPGGAAGAALTPVPAPGGHSPEQVHRTRRPPSMEAQEMSLLSSQAIAFLSAAERATSLAALAGGDVSIRQQEHEHEHEHEHEPSPSPARGGEMDPPPSPPAPGERSLAPATLPTSPLSPGDIDLYDLAYGHRNGGGDDDGRSPFDLPQPEECASPSISPLARPRSVIAGRQQRHAGGGDVHGRADHRGLQEGAQRAPRHSHAHVQGLPPLGERAESVSVTMDGGIGEGMHRQVSVMSELSFDTPSPLPIGNGSGESPDLGAQLDNRFVGVRDSAHHAGEKGRATNAQSIMSKLVPWVVPPSGRREATAAGPPATTLRGKYAEGEQRGAEGATARKRPPPELIRSIALGKRGFSALMEQAEEAFKNTDSPSKLAETVKVLAEDVTIMQKDIVVTRALVSDIAGRLRPHLDLPFYSVGGEIGEELEDDEQALCGAAR